jgi:hypothetical protein
MVENSTHVPPAVRTTTAAGREAATLLDLVHRLTEQLSTLFHQEVKLAASEIAATLSALFLNLASVATGGAVIYAGFLLLLLAAVVGLANAVPLWLASLAVGLTVAAVGVTLVLVGKQKLRASELAPAHSAASLRRDKDVLTRKVS